VRFHARRLLLAAVVLGLVASALWGASGSVGGAGLSSAKASSTQPSIVLILTDDQRFDTLWAMPHVQQDLVQHGVDFTNSYVVNPLCCPSRTTILTGKYSHSTGVYRNFAPHGAFTTFHDSGGELSTVATWLHDVGYTTALIGKYLNRYGEAALAGYVPPGWDHWAAFAQDNGAYYDYDLSLNGLVVPFGHTAADYSTNVLAGDAVSFIHDTQGPLFLYFATAAPHGPATPAPRDRFAFAELPPYRPPSYDEADVSDKPLWARKPPMSPGRRGEIDAFRLRQYQTLLSVDRAVGRIVRALEDTGRLQNTLLVFMSDNGYLWGEHRLDGKEAPYEESVRVPMVIRDDALTTVPRVDGRLALNLDLAPTFADAAGVPAPGAEGRSLLPLVAGRNGPWRRDFLIEHARGKEDIPSYLALHTGDAVYIKYGTGRQEYYDLLADPYQLHNLAGQPGMAGVMAEMLRRIGVLSDHIAPPGWATAVP
jgi:N-acetylglucosamine-6-sulfatase